MTARRYTRLYLSGFVSCLLLAAAFNSVIDPQGIFRLVTLERFNKEKPLIEKEGVRKTKSIDIERGEFTTLLLGTSRTFGGLNPEHPEFAAGAAYNAGLPETNLYEIQKVFDFSLQHLPLQQIILEVDFTTFSDERTVDADFNDSRFANKVIWLSSLDSLLALYQLKDAWTTLQFNRAGKQARYTSQGFRRKRIYGAADGKGNERGSVVNDTIDHHHLFAWADQQYLRVHAGLDYDSTERMQRLRAMLEQSHTQGVALHLFIPPLHVHLLESLSIAGLMPEFEQWKRDLVKTVDAHNRAYPTQPPLRLWDFSGVSPVTTEPVPPENSDTQMRWYVESSHFRPDLGDRMLSLMLQAPQRPVDALADFGVVLTAENIDEQLAQLRSDLAQYRKTHPEDIRDLQAFYEEVTALSTSSGSLESQQ